MRRSLFALLPLALALSGCTSTGVQVDERALTSFEKGKTTIADVVARLGQPTSNILLNASQRIIGYTYIQAQARPESFIPIIGPLVGGADSHFSNVSLTFDRNGVRILLLNPIPIRHPHRRRIWRDNERSRLRTATLERQILLR